MKYLIKGQQPPGDGGQGQQAHGLRHGRQRGLFRQGKSIES